MGDATDGPRFSRSGESIGAKCTEELKTVVPEEVRDDFTALASMHRKRPAEYLRLIVMAHLYGELESVRRKVNAAGTFGEGRE